LKIPPTQKGKKKSKALVECSTLTVSVHREKAPVRACGYINPKGYARGRRTIAGTMILTQFTVDVLFCFLQAVLPHDFSKDTTYFKPDQLPPFNATILFSDEYGHASYRRLLGLEFVTDGTVYSIQDMMTEQTVSYMASDFTPLMPVTHGMMFNPTTSSPAQAAEKTVQDLPSGTGSDCRMGSSEHGLALHARPLVRVRFRCRPRTRRIARDRTRSGGGRSGGVAQVECPAGIGQDAGRDSPNTVQPPD